VRKLLASALALSHELRIPCLPGEMAICNGRPKSPRGHMMALLQFLKNEDFVLQVAEWSWERCLDFPTAISDSCFEHSLAFTEAHQQYRELFERRADAYLAEHCIEEGNFLDLVRQYLDENLDAETDEIFQGLTASENYLTFCAYMGDVRRRREWAERAYCSTKDEVDWSELVRISLKYDLGDICDESDAESID